MNKKIKLNIISKEDMKQIEMKKLLEKINELKKELKKQDKKIIKLKNKNKNKICDCCKKTFKSNYINTTTFQQVGYDDTITVNTCDLCYDDAYEMAKRYKKNDKKLMLALKEMYHIPFDKSDYYRTMICSDCGKEEFEDKIVYAKNKNEEYEEPVCWKCAFQQ